MSEQVTAQMIAQALNIEERSVRRRAEREAWFHKIRKVRGCEQKLFPIGALPEDVQEPVLIHLSNERQRLDRAAGHAEAARIRLTQSVDARAAEAARQAGLARFVTLPEPARRRADARIALLDMAHHYLRASGFPKSSGTAAFCLEYNAGRIEAPDWVRASRPSLCANSLANWERAVEREGVTSLAGKYGQHRKGSGIIDTHPALRDLVLGMIREHPHCSGNHVMRAIRARFTQDLHPSYRTLQRWMTDWKSDNAQLLAAVTSPDAWRSKYQAAGGNASEGVVRLNQRWEADSTKGDLLLSDGRRHVIVGIIDVYSRRLKLHVSRSSSSAAVASTLRRCLIDWGVPEQLGTDNGSDYISAHIKRVLLGLGIEQDLAPPFTPEHKPFIERSFGTFCRDLAELLPGYTGHDVAQRQDIRARQSFAQRLMKEGGEKIELRLSPEELQVFCDKWTETIYARNPHAGLGGKTPFEMAAGQPIRRIGDERALDVLLAPAPDGNGVRRVGKKGIRLDGAWFEAPLLGGWEGSDVRVLLDEADIGEIFVFDSDGGFLCKAICPERTGISRQQLAAARKAVQKRDLAEEKAALKAASRRANTDTIVADILASAAESAGEVIAFPAPAAVHTTYEIEEAAKAAAQSSEGGVEGHAAMLARLGDGKPDLRGRRVDNNPGGGASGRLGEGIADRCAASGARQHNFTLAGVESGPSEAEILELPARRLTPHERKLAEKEARIAQWRAIDAAIAAELEVSDADRRRHREYRDHPEIRTSLKIEKLLAEGRMSR